MNMKQLSKIGEIEPQDLWKVFFEEIIEIKTNDRAVIILTHGFVELLINILIKGSAKNKKAILKYNSSVAIKLVLLNEMEVIKDDFYKTLTWYRNLRNRAVHDPFFEIDEKDKLSLKKYSDKLLGNIIYKEVDMIFQFSSYLMSSFWNSNHDCLIKAFSKNSKFSSP